MLVRRIVLAFVAFLALAGVAQAQLPFQVELEEVTQANAPALHSTSHAHHNGQWLFVGGRSNGLHMIIGSGDAFPAAFANGAFVVYDPTTDTRWTSSLDALPAALAASLRASNAEFIQEGTRLYVVGGYGRDASDTFVTFPTLTAIDVPGAIAAVQAGTPLAPHIRQITDTRLAVAGGWLIRLGTRLQLVGGHRFDGPYNFSVNPGQVYTDAIRSFELADDGTNMTISAYTETVDAANFHRRDGNVGPVILPGGEEAYALYGGVFTAATLPYRQPVYVTTSGHTVNAFQAQFGHYTAPMVSMYDDRTDAMHTVFFGGEGQFYVHETTGAITQDNLVPFIDDIATLSRASDGTVTETVMPVRMPGLYGTNAQFFQETTLPVWPNGVIQLEDLTARTRVGYIHGGIVSATTNPGYTNGPTEASRKIFAVYVTPDPLAAETGPTTSPLALGAPVPNPVADRAALTLALARTQDVRVEAFDAVGRRVALLHDGPLAAGAHPLTLDAAALAPGLYVVRATGAEGVAAQRVTVARP